MFSHRLALAPKSPALRPPQLAVIALAAGLSIAAFSETAPIVILRYAVFAAFAFQMWIEFAERDCVFLKSPVFLLGLAAGIGFSLIPSAGYFLAQHGYIPRFNLSAFLEMYQRPDILGYFGDTAEFYVVAFSFAALSVYGIARCLSASVSGNTPPPIPISAKTENILALTSVVLTAFSTFNMFTGALPSSAYGFLSNAYPPLQSILMMVLLHQHLTRKTGGLRLVLLLASAIAYYVAARHAKAPMYLLLSMSFYFAYMRKPALPDVLKFAAASIVFLFILAQAAQILRNEQSSMALNGSIDLNMAVDVFASKAIWRQVDTGYCLRNVIEKHTSAVSGEADHLFWLRALMPRALWPEKENLSLGNKYAPLYCGGVPDSPHSASITLLGQPIIKAGIMGLLIHTGILLAALGSLTWASIRFPGLGAVSIMALLPWWIDFDQDFALYVANLVKFFLLMCLILLPLHWLERNATPESPGTTETSSRAAD